ncbi:hypothetical protein NL676_023908 [Syzygium grande]|nr:hypothetical protein NL676_023908 [Syzygium grande]
MTEATRYGAGAVWTTGGLAEEEEAWRARFMGGWRGAVWQYGIDGGKATGDGWRHDERRNRKGDTSQSLGGASRNTFTMPRQELPDSDSNERRQKQVTSNGGATWKARPRGSSGMRLSEEPSAAAATTPTTTVKDRRQGRARVIGPRSGLATAKRKRSLCRRGETCHCDPSNGEVGLAASSEACPRPPTSFARFGKADLAVRWSYWLFVALSTKWQIDRQFDDRSLLNMF